VQVSVANTTIEISKENFYRLGKVLLPPEPEVLARFVLHGHSQREWKRSMRKVVFNGKEFEKGCLCTSLLTVVYKLHCYTYLVTFSPKHHPATNFNQLT
jgi:hypothetical protein